MAYSVNLKGVAKLRRQFAFIERRAKTLASYEGTRLIVEEARRRAPVASGRLKRNIRIKKLGQIVVKTPYAVFVHWGVPHARIGEDGRNRGSLPRQAFVYDAIEAKLDEVVAAYERELQQVTNQVVGQQLAGAARGGLRSGRRR